MKKRNAENKNRKEILEKDPTVRQEFPGADTVKEKITEGKRNIKSGEEAGIQTPAKENPPSSDTNNKN